MNEITKRQTALDILGIEETKVQKIESPMIKAQAEARNGFPVRSLLTSEIKTFIQKQVGVILINLGQKNSSDEIWESIVQDLPRTLNAGYFNWTREEMAQAWSLGSLGKLGGGEIHISPRTLIQWLDQYDEQHKKPAYRKLKSLSALKRAEDTQLPKIEEMTAEDKISALNEALRLHKSGELRGHTHFFKLLWSLGHLSTDNVDTWELVGKSNLALIQESKDIENTPVARAEAKRRREEIKNIVHPDLSTVPNFVKARMKRIAVEEYFDSLAEGYVFS